MKEALKKAQEYALKQGYPSEVTYLKKWRLSHVFRMKQPPTRVTFCSSPVFGQGKPKPVCVKFEKNNL